MICKGVAIFDDNQIVQATGLALQTVQDRRSQAALPGSTICQDYG